MSYFELEALLFFRGEFRFLKKFLLKLKLKTLKQTPLYIKTEFNLKFSQMIIEIQILQMKLYIVLNQ